MDSPFSPLHLITFSLAGWLNKNQHYHREHNFQGIGNRLINDDVATEEGRSIKVRERLGGMLR